MHGARIIRRQSVLILAAITTNCYNYPKAELVLWMWIMCDSKTADSRNWKPTDKGRGVWTVSITWTQSVLKLVECWGVAKDLIILRRHCGYSKDTRCPRSEAASCIKLVRSVPDWRVTIETSRMNYLTHVNKLPLSSQCQQHLQREGCAI